MIRLMDWLCGLGLLVLCGLKLLAPDTLADFSIVGVAVAESVLGVSFVIGRTPRASAAGLMLLGAGFCVWVLLRGPELVNGRPCGCYGPYRLDFAWHVMVATSVLLLGGVQSLLTQRRAE